MAPAIERDAGTGTDGGTTLPPSVPERGSQRPTGETA